MLFSGEENKIIMHVVNSELGKATNQQLTNNDLSPLSGPSPSTMYLQRVFLNSTFTTNNKYINLLYLLENVL